MSRNFGKNNLYIKNLNKFINEDWLESTFNQYGRIISVKIERDEQGRSKCFGFVCFKTPFEAQDALSGTNGRRMPVTINKYTAIYTRPLYVAFAQKKAERSAMLKNQFNDYLAENTAHTPAAECTPAAEYTPAAECTPAAT